MYKIEDLIKKANEVHQSKYTYDESTYVKMTEKMKITCPIHGEFWQSLHQHINKGQGCPHCGKEVQKDRNGIINKKIGSDLFFKKCKEKFGSNFQYEENSYHNLASKISIYCPKHGKFDQIAYVHLNSKCGCPKCSMEKMSYDFKCNTKDFIKKAILRHGEKYDYSKVDYVDVNTPICIICPEHGEFMQLPYNHLSGNGCPICGHKKTAYSNFLTTESFISKAKKIHGEKYNYSKVEYKGNRVKVCIICPEHGEFWQTPDGHLQGKGCKKCGNILSKQENEIYNFCCNIIGKENVIQSCRNAIKPYELDIYIPSLKMGIEYNGLHWHSEKFNKDKNYHYNKMMLCKQNDIKLIQIFEDEYINHKDIVLSKIRHLLQKENCGKIMGRKCIVREIEYEEAKCFLEKNHIQGSVSSTVYLGAFYNNLLVGVMQFKKEHIENNWELTRFATDNDYICQGVGGKLFSYFIKKYEPIEVKSFADRRWTINEENNVYTKLGFIKCEYISPEYRYFKESDGLIRQHKFAFRKEKLHKKYDMPLSMTEKEMTDRLGYTKVWDCGLIKYVWHKPYENM